MYCGAKVFDSLRSMFMEDENRFCRKAGGGAHGRQLHPGAGMVRPEDESVSVDEEDRLAGCKPGAATRPSYSTSFEAVLRIFCSAITPLCCSLATQHLPLLFPYQTFTKPGLPMWVP